jgi:hypothetical protein
MNKFCVFCGKKPATKSKEHIIPQWLIKLTGDSNRQVSIGPMWDSRTESLSIKQFAFDQFQFPACDDCNSRYSEFENKSKEIIISILDNASLSSDDFSILLNWLDKIRIGLWLAFNYLQNNLASVEPNYFIANRIGISDRAVFLYKSDHPKLGVNFLGTSVPAFQYHPVCFTIRINQYCFFNLATHFLISKNLGLPYAKSSTFTNGKEIKYSLVEGRNRIIYPLIRKMFSKQCTEIYQPIYSQTGIRQKYENWYDNDFVRSISTDHPGGIGKVFISEKK